MHEIEVFPESWKWLLFRYRYRSLIAQAMTASHELVHEVGPGILSKETADLIWCMGRSQSLLVELAIQDEAMSVFPSVAQWVPYHADVTYLPP